MSNLSQKTSEEMLKEFHTKYGHMIKDRPTLDIPQAVKILRAKLILEEVEETIRAMGFKVSIFLGEHDPHMENLSEIADGLADSKYVIVGTAITYGIPEARVFREVHNSNMTKTPAPVSPGQKYGTKTPKGPDYVAPDISGILDVPEALTVLEIRAGYKPK